MRAAAELRKGRPVCSRCGEELRHLDQWRCPYVACRAWLRDPERDDAGHQKMTGATYFPTTSAASADEGDRGES